MLFFLSSMPFFVSFAFITCKILIDFVKIKSLLYEYYK